MNIEVVIGNITSLAVDAIVNAANCRLLGGGGVDGAIHRDAGKELYEECLKLVESLPEHRGKTGQAYLTMAGKLPCKFVIHTPGPIYQDGKHGEPQLLASCYENSLRRAEEARCTSVALPCISTGVYGYPREEAAQISIKDDHKATLKLDYDGKVMKISFGNVMEYEISSNASAEYVNTFYCYPEFERPAVIVITLGFLMVKALKVTLDSVSASKIEGMAGRIG